MGKTKRYQYHLAIVLSVLLLLFAAGCAVKTPPTGTAALPESVQEPEPVQITQEGSDEAEIPDETEPEEEPVPDGPVPEGNGLCWYEDGEKLCFDPGVQLIGDRAYFVLSDGETLCGLRDAAAKMDDGARYFFESDSSLRLFQAGFVSLPDGDYYAPTEGYTLSDYSEETAVIDGALYAFDGDGRVMTLDAGVQNVFGEVYLLDEPGAAIPLREAGPLCRQDGLYCVGENGALLTNETVGYLSFGEDGRYSCGDAELDESVEAFLAEAITDWQQDTETLLETVYHHLRDNYRYLSMGHQKAGTTDWETECALTMFRQGKGNCYCWAASFSYAARRLGYQAYVVAGWEYSATNDHAWTMIDWPDGETYLFDPELEYAYWYMFSNKPKIDMFKVSGDGKHYNGFVYYFPR